MLEKSFKSKISTSCLLNIHGNTRSDKFQSEMRKEIRTNVINDIKRRSGLTEGIIVISGSTKINFSTKQKLSFYYLTGVYLPRFKAIIDLRTSKITLFAHKYENRDLIWDVADILTNEEIKQKYDVDDVFYTTNFSTALRAINPKMVFTLADETLPGNYPQNKAILKQSCDQLRSIKTDKEIELMRISSSISSRAHVEVMKQTKEGKMEYQIQQVFQTVNKNCGLPYHSYEAIVGSSHRTACLHYIQNDKKIPTSPQSNIMLIDAGNDYLGYGTDITRSFPANGKFTNDQRMVYDTVLQSQLSAVKELKPGANWANVNKVASFKLLEGLLKYGFVRNGTIEELYNLSIHRLFMMHGLGHSVGLYVHDSGSIATLSKNVVLTIEPGVYFHKFLFEGATNAQKEKLNLEMIKRFYKFGGVRIEDMYLITENGSECLSTISPKEINEIEELMK